MFLLKMSLDFASLWLLLVVLFDVYSRFIRFYLHMGEYIKEHIESVKCSPITYNSQPYRMNNADSLLCCCCCCEVGEKFTKRFSIEHKEI